MAFFKFCPLSMYVRMTIVCGRVLQCIFRGGVERRTASDLSLRRSRAVGFGALEPKRALVRSAWERGWICAGRGTVGACGRQRSCCCSLCLLPLEQQLEVGNLLVKLHVTLVAVDIRSANDRLACVESVSRRPY